MPKAHPGPMRRSRLLTVAGVIVAAIVGLFAVLDVTGIFRFGSSVSSTTFATKADLTREWDKSAPWLPGDGNGIRVKEVKRYGPHWDPAILRANSHRPLNPARCAKASRLSSPVLTAPWSPSTHLAKVWVCGDWDVIHTPEGWFGWTPNSPQE